MRCFIARCGSLDSLSWPSRCQGPEVPPSALLEASFSLPSVVDFALPSVLDFALPTVLGLPCIPGGDVAILGWGLRQDMLFKHFRMGSRETGSFTITDVQLLHGKAAGTAEGDGQAAKFSLTFRQAPHLTDASVGLTCQKKGKEEGGLPA